MDNTGNQPKITNDVQYQVIDNKVTFIGLDGLSYELGIVFEKNFILDNKMNEWWNNVLETITLQKIIEFIKNIDRVVCNFDILNSSNDSYNISYGFFIELFDNSMFSRKFNKSELNILNNKIQFIKYFFNLYGLNLDKILELKFPNSLIEYKQNSIVVTILN